MSTQTTKHYDQVYFAYQRAMGEFGGWAELTKFQDYVQPHFNVIDFGCGGGYLLNNLRCTGKIGIELNESARRHAEMIGITVHAGTDAVENEWADVIISNHALEHCLEPLQELRALHPKLKRGGRIVFVVPCESIRRRYHSADRDHHLYSWSPMCLGNLVAEAGFIVESSAPYMHKWPPGYRQIARIGGRRLFEVIGRIYGHLNRSLSQVRVVAHRAT